jgi:drug/metabolite transporter (DMT)-like permease
MSLRLQGFLWCATFVVLDAAQAVLFGGFLQRLDSLLVGFLVFGLSSLACLAFVLLRAPREIRSALDDPRTLVALNVTSAGGWLAYLGSIQLIEPAVAFTIFSGIIPLTVVAARTLLRAAAATALDAWERIGLAVLTLGLAALSVSTIAGWSGFVRGGAGVAALGVGLSVVSGIAMSGMLLASYRLSHQGVGPAAVFGLRFPLYLLLAGCGYLLGLDDKGSVAPSDLLLAVMVGLCVLAFPIYAVQKAVSLTSALTLGAATALIPVVVLAMQMAEGRVAYSGATAVGLAIYTAGALIAAAGRARAEARVVA